jgi:hypothetical protein
MLIVFSGLRVYALCGHSISIFVIVFALNMVAFGANMVSNSPPSRRLVGQISNLIYNSHVVFVHQRASSI